VNAPSVRPEPVVRGTSLFVLLNALWRLAGRALLLALWSAVIWGSLLLSSMAVSALSDGPGPVLDRLDPRGRPGLLPWINAACVFLTPFAWASVAFFLPGKARKTASR
jgi:hypothetical protein